MLFYVREFSPQTSLIVIRNQDILDGYASDLGLGVLEGILVNCRNLN